MVRGKSHKLATLRKSRRLPTTAGAYTGHNELLVACLAMAAYMDMVGWWTVVVGVGERYVW
jgi:hypothetical protein